VGKVDFQRFMSSEAEKVIFQTSVSCMETAYFPVENNPPWYVFYSRVHGETQRKTSSSTFLPYLYPIVILHGHLQVSTCRYMLRAVCQLLSFMYNVLMSPVSHKGLYAKRCCSLHPSSCSCSFDLIKHE
jgi:hypothetical protein